MEHRLLPVNTWRGCIMVSDALLPSSPEERMRIYPEHREAPRQATHHRPGAVMPPPASSGLPPKMESPSAAVVDFTAAHTASTRPLPEPVVVNTTPLPQDSSCWNDGCGMTLELCASPLCPMRDRSQPMMSSLSNTQSDYFSSTPMASSNSSAWSPYPIYPSPSPPRPRTDEDWDFYSPPDSQGHFAAAAANSSPTSYGPRGTTHTIRPMSLLTTSHSAAANGWVPLATVTPGQYTHAVSPRAAPLPSETAQEVGG